MGLYKQVWDGEPIIQKNTDDWYVQCCDCGLVHKIVIRHNVKGGFSATFYRNNQKTAAVRRGKACKEQIRSLIKRSKK